MPPLVQRMIGRSVCVCVVALGCTGCEARVAYVGSMSGD